MDTSTPVTTATRSYCERAAATFMTFSFNAAKPLMQQQLHKSVVKQILRVLEEQRQDGSNDAQDERAVITTINLFGAHQKDYKDACIAPAANLRNLISYETWPTSPIKGTDRLMLTVEVPTKYYGSGDGTGYQERAEKARQSVRDFFPFFEQFAEAGKRLCDANFPFKVVHPKTGKMVRVSETLTYPTKKEFEEMFWVGKGDDREFYIKLGTPRQLPVFDMERAVAMPPGYAKKVADAHDRGMIAAMESVKAIAIETTVEAMDVLANQLAKADGRLHQPIVDQALHAARGMRKLVEGYDHSTAIIKLAEVAEEKIAKAVVAWESFKESPRDREQVRDAAAAIRDKLRAAKAGMAKAKPQTQPAPAPAKPTTAPSKPTKATKVAGAGLVSRL